MCRLAAPLQQALLPRAGSLPGTLAFFIFLCHNQALFHHFFLLKSLAFWVQPRSDVRHIVQTLWVFLAQLYKFFLSQVSLLELLEAQNQLLVIHELCLAFLMLAALIGLPEILGGLPVQTCSLLVHLDRFTEILLCFKFLGFSSGPCSPIDNTRRLHQVLGFLLHRLLLLHLQGFLAVFVHLDRKIILEWSCFVLLLIN